MVACSRRCSTHPSCRPSTQRDFLLSLAVEGLYRPVWGSAILDELEYHESIKLQERGVPRDEAEARAVRLIQRMTVFSDAEVTGWEPLEGTFGLPDPDDEHVAAAAALAGAGAIVTSNLKDFPADRLPDSLQALPPDEFAANTVSLDPPARPSPSPRWPRDQAASARSAHRPICSTSSNTATPWVRQSR
jgi:hypothetical protein